MQCAFKFRLYPNKTQQVLINKTLGCSRFVYNYFLDLSKNTYQQSGKSLSFFDCNKLLTDLKKQTPWLTEVDKNSLQNALRDLNSAYQNFFRELKKGNSRQGLPKFKSKRDNNQSYRTNITNGNIRIDGNRIKLPKLGWVKFAKSREIEDNIINATLRKAPSGKYFISVLVEAPDKALLPALPNAIGLDLGIKDFASFSTGTKIPNPKTLYKMERKLKRLQRQHARKQKGSKNRNKSRLKVARLHERIANTRMDFLHQLSTQLIRENQALILESLKIKNMVKNHHLAKAISDASWGEFNRQLQYKATWYGRIYHQLGTFYPSSQLCHVCRTQNPAVKNLAIRQWICPQCGAIHDRDINAAKNIVNQGLKELNLNLTA